MSRCYSNRSRFGASLDASPKSIATSRLSLESSSSQSECPPPPPDSDSDESTHCSSESDNSQIANRSTVSAAKSHASSRYTVKRSYHEDCHKSCSTAKSANQSIDESDLKPTDEECQSDDECRGTPCASKTTIERLQSTNHCSEPEHESKASSTCSTKSTTRSFQLNQTGDECSYDDHESGGDDILGDLFDLPSSPVYISSYIDLSEDSSDESPCGIQMQTSAANSHSSNEGEMNRWMLWRRMYALIRVTRTFALRCGLDHWKRSCSIGSDYKPVKSLLEKEKRRMPLELALQVFGMIERVEVKVILRMAFYSLKAKIEQRKEHHNAAVHLISRIVQKALLRAALRSWIYKQRSLVSKLLAVNNYVAKSRSIMVIKRCIQAWRAHTANAIKKRQQFFLMMIFNRWKLFTEDRVEQKEKEIVALMHWASTVCSKAFDGLRECARQSRQRKSLSSYSCPNRYLSPLTTANSTARTWGDAHRPFSISYRSPETSMVINRTPDVFSRLATKWGYNSGVHQSARHKDVHLLHGYRREECIGFKPAQQVDQNTFSRALNASVPPRRFGYANENQDISDSTQNASLAPNHGNSSGHASTRLPSVRFDFSGEHTAYETSTSRASMIRYPTWAESQPKMVNPQLGSLSFTNCGIYSMPSHTVRSMKDFYKDRFEISALLDEMVTRVEHMNMWQRYQPIHRYAGYAGCDEELLFHHL